MCQRLEVGPCGSPMRSMYKGKPFKEKNLVSAGLRAGAAAPPVLFMIIEIKKQCFEKKNCFII